MELQEKFEELIISKQNINYDISDIIAEKCVKLCLEEKLSTLLYLRVSGDDNPILIKHIETLRQQINNLCL